jgi:hypothetical protein
VRRASLRSKTPDETDVDVRHADRAPLKDSAFVVRLLRAHPIRLFVRDGFVGEQKVFQLV